MEEHFSAKEKIWVQFPTRALFPSLIIYISDGVMKLVNMLVSKTSPFGVAGSSPVAVDETYTFLKYRFRSLVYDTGSIPVGTSDL